MGIHDAFWLSYKRWNDSYHSTDCRYSYDFIGEQLLIVKVLLYTTVMPINHYFVCRNTKSYVLLIHPLKQTFIEYSMIDFDSDEWLIKLANENL